MNRKRILVLTPRFPYPVIGGDKLRIHELCKRLATGHSLTLLSLCGSRSELRAAATDTVFDDIRRIYLPAWQSLWQALIALGSARPLQLAYYRSSAFGKAVRELTAQHDLVLAHLIRTGQYLTGREGPPKILEMTDAISLNYSRFSLKPSTSLKDRLYGLEARRLEPYERRTLREFDLVTLVSDVDRQFLLGNTRHEPQVRVYSNGVDTHRLPYLGPGEDPCAVFIGNMRTAQNIDACEYFANEVLPILKQSNPAFRFKIAGIASSRVMQRFNRIPGVEITGQVDSIADAVRGASCGVCPVRLGAGVQNKVLEYFALGLPAVVTSVGLEGIDATHGEHVLVADDPQTFAFRVAGLCRDKPLQQRLAKAARALVCRKHAWSEVLAGFCKDVDELLGGEITQPEFRRAA